MRSLVWSPHTRAVAQPLASSNQVLPPPPAHSLAARIHLRPSTNAAFCASHMSSSSDQNFDPSSSSSSSRQHPHLPAHVSNNNNNASTGAGSPLPALPIEPSDSRHQAYLASQNLGGRRGSTDPLLHASMAATATANAQGTNGLGGHASSPQHQLQQSPHYSAFTTVGAESPSSSANSRKRNAALAMLDQQGASTDNSNGSQQQTRYGSPSASGVAANTLPPLGAEGTLKSSSYRVDHR